MRKPLGAMELHDTQLDSVQVSLIERSCVVRVLGVSGDLPTGRAADISCHALESLFLTFDSAELARHAWAGNVQDGHFKQEADADVFRLSLTGGMLEARGGQLASMVYADPVPPSASVDALGPDIDFDRATDEPVWGSTLTGLVCSVPQQQIKAKFLWPADLIAESAPGGAERVPLSVCFDGVRSCTIRFDASAMVDSQTDRSMVNVRFDSKRGLYWLHLYHGIVEIAARRMTARQLM